MKKSIFILIVLAIVSSTIHAQNIFDAVKKNDIAGVKEAVEKDISAIYLKNASGNTPLHIAAITGSLQMAEYLLSKGADINAVNARLNTPLHESINSCKDEMAGMLIEKGCGIESRDNIGRVPLHYAAEKNSKSIVELLLSKGADIESKTNANLTPLHYLILMKDNIELAEYLINKGANVNTLAGGGMPLNTAAYHCGSKMINLLLDNNADFDTSESNLMNTLLSAVRKGSIRLFSAIVDKVGDRLFKNESDNQLIMQYALGGGSLEIVKILQSKKIKINLSPNVNGWTPLHYTASGNQPEMMEFLVKNGADIKQRTKSGKSVYNIAAENGNKDLLGLIIKLGGNSEPQKFPLLTGPYLGQILPGDKYEPFAPDIVFTNHSSVSVSPDGKEIYWALDPVILMSKIENGVWTKPEIVSFSGKSNAMRYDDVPFVTPDNKKIFFTSLRPVGEGTGNKENIWYAERTASGWGEPKPVSQDVNAMGIHWQISVSDSGTLYFGGNKEGVAGIYYSKLVEGEYTKPELLVYEGNKNFGGNCPYISPDESYIIFARLLPNRRTALHISYKLKNGNWLAPVALPVNGNIGPEAIVSPDGKYLFNRNKWVSAKFIEEMKPKE